MAGIVLASAAAISAGASAPAPRAPAPRAPTPRAPAPRAPTPLDVYVAANPHCRQATTSTIKPFFTEEKLQYRPLSEAPHELTEQSQRMPFVNRPDRDRSPLHFGQLKLHESEKTFLVRHTDACAGTPLVVVYAGAAPGNHIAYLAGMFPSCQFMLYDPAEFCAELRRSPPVNVQLFEETFFTESVASALEARFRAEGTKFAFISDIRTGKEESFVQVDMARQESWVRTLKPDVAMIKFRLPWGAGRTEYLDGDIMLPVFAPLTSTECRLISTRAHAEGPPRVYDNRAYEEWCAFHNSVGRIRCYEHDIKLPGLDHCHDCSMLVRTTAEYLQQTGQGASRRNITRLLRSTIDSFGGGRTLATRYAPSSNRGAKKFARRTFTGDKFQLQDQ